MDSPLREYTDAQFVAMQREILHLEETLSAATTAVHNEAVLRFELAKEATNKAEVANDKRFESVNEFRAQLAEQAASFLPREVADTALNDLRKKTDENTRMITEINASQHGAAMRQTVIIAVATFVILVMVALANFVTSANASEMPTPAYKMGGVPTPCASWMAGCSDGYTIWISNHSRWAPWSLSHELGHNVDAQWLTKTDRRNLTPTLGRPVGTAWHSTPLPDLAERFAEGYSLCSMTKAYRLDLFAWWAPKDWPFGNPSAYRYPSYPGRFTFGQLARICGYVRLVAHRVPGR